MSKPIRILQVFGQMNIGGAETMIMNMYRNIDRSKVQFDFIVHTNKKCFFDDEIKKLGGKIYSVPVYKGSNHIIYVNSWKKLFREHKEYKIIHTHMRSTAAIYLKIAKKYGLFTIAHSHSTSSGYGVLAVVKNMLQYPIRFIADYFFSCSISAGEWLFGKKVCKTEKFYILKNAIDAKRFVYNESVRIKIREELHINDKFVVGHIGRFCVPKNHEFLIDIFREVYDRNKNAVLLLVGDGELQSLIKKKVIELGLDRNVIFVGVREDINNLLQAMDVFVFPSLFEGLGTVLIEAQAAGLRSLASDNITREVVITDSIAFQSLNSKPVEWAKKILNYSDYRIREDTLSKLETKGYDIADNAKWLEDFYLTLQYKCN